MEYLAALQTCANVCIMLGCFMDVSLCLADPFMLAWSARVLLAFPGMKSCRRHDTSSYFSLHWTAAWHLSWQSRHNIFHPLWLPKAACTLKQHPKWKIMFFSASFQISSTSRGYEKHGFAGKYFLSKMQRIWCFSGKKLLPVVINVVSN